MREFVFRRSLTVSILIHAGFAALLFLVARTQVPLDVPLRVRLIEPPPVQTPPSTPAERVAPPPQAVPREVPRGPKAGPIPSTRWGAGTQPSRGERFGLSEHGDVSVARRPAPAPDMPVAPAPPPQTVARPRAPEPPSPAPEPLREARPEPVPERGGLSLSGPSPDRVGRGTSSRPQPSTPSRPSLRDQIAGLSSGLRADAGPGKDPINLNSRDPRYMGYNDRLQQRIYREWTYPEDAQRVGINGELVLEFTVSRTGTLTDIHLVDSSGFPILDNEALRAVKAAAPFDAFPPQMGDDPSKTFTALFRYYPTRRYRWN